MILSILALSALCVFTNQQTPETFQFQESDAIVKRQITSYKSNIIHHDPKYKNGQAESIIQFEMFPQAKPEENEKPVTPKNYGNYNHQQTEPLTAPKFSYNYKGGNNRNVPYHSTEQKQVQPQTTTFTNRVTTVSPYIPQSQAINVGYSVSFAGKPDTKHKFSKQSQDGAEIITGFRKETVRQPTTNFQNNPSQNEPKKPKPPTIRPKSTISNTKNENNEAKTFINTLSSQPFEYFSKLQKPNRTTQNRVKPAPNDAENAESITSAAWMNLSPYVELYRSEEQKQNLNAYKEQQRPANFNLMMNPPVIDLTNIYDTQTQKAQSDFNRNVFGRSERGQSKPPAFDFTSMYNTQTEKAQNDFNGNPYGRNEQTQNNFSPINYPTQDLTTQQIYQQFKQMGPIPLGEPGNLQTQQSESFPQVSRPMLDVPKLMHQYPADTSLLRDYGSTMNRPLEASMMQATQQQAANAHLFNNGNQVQNNFDYSGRQIPNFYVQPNLNYQNHYQSTNQVNSYAPEWSQGKNNNFDSYFDYTFANLQPQETQTKSAALLNNDNYGNYGTRTKPIRSIQLHQDLQPPPANTRNRRHFVY